MIIRQVACHGIVPRGKIITFGAPALSKLRNKGKSLSAFSLFFGGYALATAAGYLLVVASLNQQELIEFIEDFVLSFRKHLGRDLLKFKLLSEDSHRRVLERQQK